MATATQTQTRATTQPTNTNFLLFDRPCWRSMWVCKKIKCADYIISLKNGRVLRKIEPVICRQGHEPKYRFYPSDNVALIHYYKDTIMGKHHIDILWKPSNVSVEEVVEKVKHALFLYDVPLEVHSL